MSEKNKKNIKGEFKVERYSELTIARHKITTNPNMEKYTMKAGRLNRWSKSSRDRVGSGTMPKNAIKMAPPAIRMVARIIHGEKTSPRIKRAKKAFHNRDTAPNGARITTGREAIWTSDPRILEEMNMANPNSHNLDGW